MLFQATIMILIISEIVVMIDTVQKNSIKIYNCIIYANTIPSIRVIYLYILYKRKFFSISSQEIKK